MTFNKPASRIQPIMRTVMMAYALSLFSREAVADVSLYNIDGGEHSHPLLQFVAIGDWGAPISSERAVNRQRAVADGIASWLHRRKGSNVAVQSESLPFIISLGDNFYPSGVSGSDDEVAMRFAQSFEQIYSHDAYDDVPWYIVPGNKDYEGDVAAQIRYAESSSSRWVFPDYFHRIVREVKVPGDGGTVKIEILAIDTTRLESFEEDAVDIITSKTRALSSSFMAQKGLKWIEHHLSSSDADYLLVAGHHPIHAVGYMGTVPGLEPMLENYKVSAYLSGHIHCGQHITNGGVDYFVSGSGMEYSCDVDNTRSRSSRSKVNYVVGPDNNPTGAIGGFLSFDVTQDKLAIRFHDESGNELYQTEILPRRQSSDQP